MVGVEATGECITPALFPAFRTSEQSRRELPLIQLAAGSTDMNAPQVAVIFDMDGLMLNSEPVYRLACITAAAALGCSVTDTLYHQLLGRTEADAEQILQTYFQGRLDVGAFRTMWADNFSAAVEVRNGEEGWPR